MEYLLNEELVPLVNNGKLNFLKIQCLLIIKEFINRVSSNDYIDDNDLKTIYKKYKAMPSVLSWGDYFQTELAFDIIDFSDEDFKRAIDTIKFDIISSYIIFSQKDNLFFEWVENNYQYITSKKNEVLQDEYEEVVHLKILKDYYINLEIVDKFTSIEMVWYNNYKERVAS